MTITIASNFQQCSCTFLGSNKNINVSRDNVYIWFDDPLPRNLRNKKTNLEIMIKLVSGTFGTIAIDNAPILDQLHSLQNCTTDRSGRLYIPSVVAEHNRRSISEKQMKVIVSFDLSPSSDMEKNPSHHNSFVVAKHYADIANSIFPGSVDTLLLHHDDYLRVNSNTRQGHRMLPSEFHSVGKALMNSQYKLGVTVSQNLCENGLSNNSSEILTNFVQYADLVIPVVYTKPLGTPKEFTPCVEHEKQLASLQNCDRVLKTLKPDVEIIPLVICNGPKSPDNGDTSKFFQCWQLMSEWARRNNRKVIMYEAFDRFDSAHEYVDGVGWWRLKNEAARSESVNDSSFIKKPQGSLTMTCKLSKTATQELQLSETYNLAETDEESFFKEFILDKSKDMGEFPKYKVNKILEYDD